MATRRKPARRVGGKRPASRRGRWLLALALLAAAFGAGVWFAGRPRGLQPPADGGGQPVAAPSTDEPYAEVEDQPSDRQQAESGDLKATAHPQPAEPSREATAPASAAPVTVPPADVAPVGNLALVIDDLGRSLADLDTLQGFGVPISYAVLPYESMTPQVVATLRKRNVELLLHLPMEASNGADPGPGSLRSTMTPAELRASTLRALAAVPGAVGVNNHMGSELSGDSRAMGSVLQVLAEKDLFYLDSRTSAASVGFQVARELGIPAAERQVFLDPDPGIDAVRAEVARWLALAREKGAAIAIGHPHPATLTVLAEEIPKARAAGFEFVPVSYLLVSEGGPE
jgi:polysaccharide deacetylase 2 family uncharacterized protein YibQ